MRILTGLLAVALIAGSPLSAPAASFSAGPAPADEYFGPHHESILEIRNRLRDFDGKTDAEMLEPGVVNQLDDIAYSISDWRHQYPNDPWLPRSYAELVYAYQRAGQLSSPHGAVAFSEMQTAYPNAPETRDTMAMVSGNQSPLLSLFAAATPIVASVPSIQAPAPIAIAAPPPAPAKSAAWARFDAMRSGSSPGNP
jgi:hypothetical protein